MSAAPLNPAERIAALRRFGYSEAEASFLATAALHSGYFLRRQLAQVLGCRDGGRVTQLTQKALDLEHARSSTWRQNTQLYHLCARPLYESLGEPDNRNRRTHGWTQIKNRIMCLDFVLAHSGRRLATECDKLEYFTGTRGLDPACLPHARYRSSTGRAFTVRYFVDKHPVFIAGDTEPDGGRVSFAFVDEGLVGLSRFENYLGAYGSLFAALKDFQLIYVAARATHFAGARSLFERRCAHSTGVSGSLRAADIERLLMYFKLRYLYEQGDLERFDRAQLIRLRNDREAFAGPEADALYLTWRTRGDDIVRRQLAAKRDEATAGRGAFSTELLAHGYGLFGDTWPR